MVAIAIRVLAFYVGLEACAFVGVFGVTGQAFTFGRMTEARQAQVDLGLARRPARQAPGAVTSTTAIVPHPYLGFVYDPHFDPTGTRKLHSVPVSNWGFLDDKSPIQAKSTDRVVIGIFGGSVAFWLSIHGLPAISEELARVPELQGKELVFVRTALGGFKQPQQLMAMSYLLAVGAHFDFVINLDGFNEVGLPVSSNVPQGYAPFFPFNWPSLLGAIGDPVRLRLVGEITYLEARRGRQAEVFSWPGLRHSVFGSLVWTLLDRNVARRIQADQAELVMATHPSGGPAGPFAATGPERTYTSAESMYADFAEVWMQSSLAMSHLSAARGIRYFHFLQPNQYLEGSKPIGAAERRVAFQPGTGYEKGVRGGYGLLREKGRWLAAHGAAFEDLSMVFVTVDQPLYIDPCCHLNTEGNMMLARRIGQSIRRQLESAASGRSR